MKLYKILTSVKADANKRCFVIFTRYKIGLQVFIATLDDGCVITSDRL